MRFQSCYSDLWVNSIGPNVTNIEALWKTGDWPEVFTNSVATPLPKKGGGLCIKFVTLQGMEVSE